MEIKKKKVEIKPTKGEIFNPGPDRYEHSQ